MKYAALAFLLLLPGMSGCLDFLQDEPRAEQDYVDLGFDGEQNWPSLKGQTIRILDHGAFPAFSTAARAFENLTGAKVQQTSADDTGDAFNRALKEVGDPSYDILYGIDNMLYKTAVDAGLFEAYRPVLAKNIAEEYVFFDGPWYATPVDHGYVGINVDYRDDQLAGEIIGDLAAVRNNAGLFVTEDPRTSTPGLAFLLITIANYPDAAPYNWQDYWAELFQNGVRVTSGWSEAYENYFTGGYGNSPDNSGYVGGYPIVTSYTESPAYEAYYGATQIADPLLAPGSTFHQIQTMGILKGTPNRAGAQAWIEFTLTDTFQEYAAPFNAVYPVNGSIAVDGTYGGLDPQPGSFQPAELDYRLIGKNLERWLEEWTALCEDYNCD